MDHKSCIDDDLVSVSIVQDQMCGSSGCTLLGPFFYCLNAYDDCCNACGIIVKVIYAMPISLRASRMCVAAQTLGCHPDIRFQWW